MARTKKAKKSPAKTTSAKKTPAQKTKARPAARAKKAAAKPRGKAVTKASARKGRAKRGTEVERRWSDYLGQRTQLEKAVQDVRDAEASLATARDRERQLRQAFDDSKSSLEQLLEVGPASETGVPAPRVLDSVPSLHAASAGEDMDLG